MPAAVAQRPQQPCDCDGFTEARDSEWQWHQLGHMQICTSPQADNHASTHHSVFLQTGCPSCHPTNSVKALKALTTPANNTRSTTHLISQHFHHSMLLLVS